MTYRSTTVVEQATLESTVYTLQTVCIEIKLVGYWLV